MGINTSVDNKSSYLKIKDDSIPVGPVKRIITSTDEMVKKIAEETSKLVIQNNSTDVEFFDIDPVTSDTGFSNTEYNDEDNINVNQLSKIMVEFQNALTGDGENRTYYDMYSELVKGKRLGDIIDGNGHVRDSSSFSDEDLAKIEELIMQKGLDISVEDYLKFFDKCVTECSKEGEASVTLTHISDDMLNNVIEEVVSTDNSYDAFVLKNPDNGNYMIVNSCTNAKSTKDLLAIAYAMCMQLTGSLDLIDYMLGYLLPSLDSEMLDAIKETDLYKELKSGDKNAAKKLEEIYQNELKDNQELIKKYIEKAKEEGTQVELQGYSLGGGIQLAAYSSLCVENPEYEDYISSVTVFNPYISFCEENPMNLNEKTEGGNGSEGLLIDYLAHSDKLRIYSNEEDYVSTFNNSVGKLYDKYCFIQSQDLADHAKVDGVADIYGIVIGGGSNHGFGVIDYDSFEDGNIHQQGRFYAIDESMVSTTEQDTEAFHIWSEFQDELNGGDFPYRIDYANIIEHSLGLEHIREMVSDNGPEAEAFFDAVLNYIENNVGDYHYDDLADAIADGCWDAIMVGAKDKISDYLGWVPMNVDDKVFEALVNYSREDEFKQGIKDFLKEDENMDLLMDAIGATINNDKETARDYYNQLLDKLSDSIGSSNADIWVDILSDSGGLIPSIDYESLAGYVINQFMRDQFIDQLRDIVEEI